MWPKQKNFMEKTEWGTMEMLLTDPFGNHIIFVDDTGS